MSGLVLNLKPKEKFIINGAVIQNGAKRTQIRVEDDNANVLRLSDAIHPDDVNTPVKRAYYLAQLLISCDMEETEGREKLAKALAELINVFRSGDPADRLAKAVEGLANRHYYSVMVQLKHVLPAEEVLLSFASAKAKTVEEPLLMQAG